MKPIKRMSRVLVVLVRLMARDFRSRARRIARKKSGFQKI
jgi:hypothetical protein